MILEESRNNLLVIRKNFHKDQVTALEIQRGRHVISVLNSKPKNWLYQTNTAPADGV